jgi:hypothetical protein
VRGTLLGGSLRWHHGWTGGVQDDISGIVAQIQEVSSLDGRLPTWNVATPLFTVQNLSLVNGFTSDVPTPAARPRAAVRSFKMADRSP